MFTQKILSYKKILKINMFFLILCLAINIILFKNLPNKIALQIVESGELGNYIPKLFFIFFTPIVISRSVKLNEHCSFQLLRIQ